MPPILGRKVDDIRDCLPEITHMCQWHLGFVTPSPLTLLNAKLYIQSCLLLSTYSTRMTLFSAILSLGLSSSLVMKKKEPTSLSGSMAISVMCRISLAPRHMTRQKGDCQHYIWIRILLGHTLTYIIPDNINSHVPNWWIFIPFHSLLILSPFA